MTFAFNPPPTPSVAIRDSADRFPVHRIYCVGRNYAAHAREMGADPSREPPFFFCKPADAIWPADTSVGAGGTPSSAPPPPPSLPYASATSNLHHEIELVVAIGKAGRDIPAERANQHIFGYALGLDMTRRDLQTKLKDNGHPWEVGKAFDHSAPISSITPVAQSGHPASGKIWLEVNDQRKQQGDLADMIWSVPEIIQHLSTYFELQPGDLIFTGTPEGVGPVKVGDVLVGDVADIAAIALKIGVA